MQDSLQADNLVGGKDEIIFNNRYFTGRHQHRFSKPV
jgi:hypothetical protein